MSKKVSSVKSHLRAVTQTVRVIDVDEVLTAELIGRLDTDDLELTGSNSKRTCPKM